MQKFLGSHISHFLEAERLIALKVGELVGIHLRPHDLLRPIEMPYK